MPSLHHVLTGIEQTLWYDLRPFAKRHTDAQSVVCQNIPIPTLQRSDNSTLVAISGQKLSCIKQDRTLFSNVSFTLAPSELLHVCGQNGAGKTSLLRIIVGLSEPANGSVQFGGQDAGLFAAEYHQTLVYLGHKPGLNMTLNALENLLFWCRFNQVKVSQDAIYSVLAEVGLVGLEDLPVGQLSAGQQRRVALTRIWLKTAAKIWVLDEPFTALDVQGIDMLKQKIRSHLLSGGSVILTSHQSFDLDYPTKKLWLDYQL